VRPALALPFLAALLALLLAGSASARVIVVADGGPSASLLDVRTNALAGRLTSLPGPARAVAAAPDGSRAFLGTGDQVLAVDLTTRLPSAATRVGGRVTALAVAPDGARVYASRAA